MYLNGYGGLVVRLFSVFFFFSFVVIYNTNKHPQTNFALTGDTFVQDP